MKVYLAEKPEVASHITSVIDPKAVKKYGYYQCANGDIVTWCIGHLLTLSDPQDFEPSLDKWNLEQLPMAWPVKYKTKKKVESQLKVVVSLLKKASTIISCVDIDASGQAIADEIFEQYDIAPHKVLRALINDNNPKKIIKAISPEELKPNSEFRTLYLQEKARAVADQRVGYNLTRLLTCQAQKQGFNETLNVGRVQSSILGLVVRRYRERSLHIPHNYYLVRVECQTEAGPLMASLNIDEHDLLERDDKGRLTNYHQVKNLITSLDVHSVTLTDIQKKEVFDSPPLPYDLLSLQSDCSRYYGLEPDEVLDITQKLREAPFYAITYNRSDCRYIPDEVFESSEEIISALSSIDGLDQITLLTDHTVKSRAFNSAKTTAHGAIIPTGSVADWEQMTDEMKAVFILIARNYLIQFMPKRQRFVLNYTFTLSNEQHIKFHFNGRAQTVESAGWSIVFRNDDEAEDELEDVSPLDIKNINKDTRIDQANVFEKELVTNPPPLYIMSTLLSDLKSTAKYIQDPKLKAWMLEKDKHKEGEQGGIGTAATRSGILKELFNKNVFTRNKKKQIIPTQKGELLYDLLPASITSPDTTAIWSNFFRLIGDGETTPEHFWSEVDSFIQSAVTKVKENGLAIPDNLIEEKQTSPDVLQACPLCQGNANRRKGKYGWFWQCSSCETYFDDLKNRLFYKCCEKCGKRLKVKKAQNKLFLGCSGYPDCKHTEPSP